MGTASEWFVSSLAQKLMHKLKYENEKSESLALPPFLQGVHYQNSIVHSAVCVDLALLKMALK